MAEEKIDYSKHYVGECPKCKWRTRELYGEEIESCQLGRLRCSGTCIATAVPNAPSTFSPKLKLTEIEVQDEEAK